MARLPIYFVIDVSDSMVGATFESLKKGLALCFDAINSEPYMLEIAALTVITFAGKVVRPVSMVDAFCCPVPELYVGSGSALGKALDFLMDDMEENLRPRTADRKGDWRPFVFLFTDGYPTDDCRAAVERWNTRFKHRADLAVLTISRSANLPLLREISDNIAELETMTGSSFRDFFRCTDVDVNPDSRADTRWRHLNVSEFLSQTKPVGRGADSYRMRPANNCVTLHAKCSTTREHYIIKFDRNADGDGYKLSGSYPIDIDRYEALSTKVDTAFSIDADLLDGHVTCPCCPNEIGLLKCGACGSIFCSTGSKFKFRCPWCGKIGRLVSESISVKRTLG